MHGDVDFCVVELLKCSICSDANIIQILFHSKGITKKHNAYNVLVKQTLNKVLKVKHRFNTTTFNSFTARNYDCCHHYRDTWHDCIVIVIVISVQEAWTKYWCQYDRGDILWNHNMYIPHGVFLLTDKSGSIYEHASVQIITRV